MTIKHTPAPWFYTTEGKNALGLVEEDGTNIMHMATLENSTAASCMEANARLIAAAPDLLAALQTILAIDVKGHELRDRLQFSTDGRAIIEQCNKAIAKAIGS